MKSQGKTKVLKVRERSVKFALDQGKVREKSVNFVFGQGSLEFCCLKSEKSHGNLYHFGYFKVFLTFIQHLNKKNKRENVKHVTFSLQIVMFKVSEICSKSRKSRRFFFVPMCGYPAFSNYSIFSKTSTTLMTKVALASTGIVTTTIRH